MNHDKSQARNPVVRDLPSGTVIFLFTDIEGSTSLWERDRPAMVDVVERHLALLDVSNHLRGSGSPRSRKWPRTRGRR
jgi:class 3 adenylate cyclase